MSPLPGPARRPRAVVSAVSGVALVAVGVLLLLRGPDEDPAGQVRAGVASPSAPAEGPSAGAATVPGAAATVSPPAPGSRPARAEQPQAGQASTAAAPEPPASTPTAGSLDPVPYEEVIPEPPVPLTATADFRTGLTVQVTDIESVRSVAQRPGEISAPALRLTLQARNSSAEPISLDGMVVTLEYGADRTPAINVHEPAGAPFEGVLAPGDSVQGVYVFNVPDEARSQIRVTTSYTGEAPTLVLAGPAE